MFEYDENKHKFFGESAFYEENEKEEAKTYLILWKKNLLRRLKRDSYDVKVLDEQWIERPAHIVSSLANLNTMALKICVEADWHYELRKFLI